MKKLLYNILAVLLMAVFIVFLVVGNVFRVSTSVATPAGSYAEQYAKKHHLTQVNVPDTIKEASELRYETFEYNLSAGVLTLEKYNGVGKEIVIPISIEGYTVKKIGEKFFADSPTVSDIYLAPGYVSVMAEPLDGITIHVNAGSKEENELTEAGWTVKTYNDSDMPIFTMGDIPYEYNNTADGVELVHYFGNEKTLLIPAYIDGKPVKTISFDMLGFDLVSFPATVSSITGKTALSLYTKSFAIELVFTILMFVAVLLVLNAKLSKLKNKDEYLLTGPQIVLSYVFFIGQIVFALLVIYRDLVDWLVAFLVSALLLIIYLALILMAGQGRKHAVTVTETNKARTRFMDELKLSVANLDSGITDRDVRKQVTRVVEEIKYSDPTDNDALTEIQTQLHESVMALKQAISDGDQELIIKLCETTLQLTKERNNMCKAYK